MKAGYAVVLAANGQECVDAVARHPPSLVILDLQMPVKDGLTALRELRANGADMPVVVTTAHGSLESAIAATRLGANAFLSKPFDLREVELTVARVLEEDRLKREVAAERRRVEREQLLLAQVGAILASTLDGEAPLVGLAEAVVVEFADWCIVDLLERDRPARRFKVACRDRQRVATADALERFPLDRSRPHLGSSVLETRRSTLIEDVTPDHLRSFAQDDEHLRLLQAVGPTSLMAVPLLAHTRLVGALIFLTSSVGRRFGPDDLRLAEELARRAALAVDNALLYASARQAVRARDLVLGAVAHDLRSPLNSIMLQAQILRRPGHDEETTRLAEQILRRGKEMSRFIEDLLDEARIEAGELSLRRAHVGARQIIVDALETHRDPAAAASLELVVAAASDLPDVWADRQRLLQVFDNLIGNARKFTPPGGRITVGATCRDGWTTYTVADTGPGVRAVDVPRLFDRYWQADGGDRRGAGLGLPIVKGIVEAHGGRVWVESSASCGTTFFFTIPEARNGAPSAPGHP